jgi:hypothetical protein
MVNPSNQRCDKCQAPPTFRMTDAGANLRYLANARKAMQGGRPPLRAFSRLNRAKMRRRNNISALRVVV